MAKRTRRDKWKSRKVLKVGETGLSGIVAMRQGNIGFIQPRGAARIFFHMDNVPENRRKCVGQGEHVYFKVIRGVSDRRGRERISAQIL